jgi:chromosome segregation ATPase
MAVQMPQLKRGLFGYRPKSVRVILSGREIMYARLSQRLGTTEGELGRTRTELEGSQRAVREQVVRARAAEEELVRQRDLTKAGEARAIELQEEIEQLRSRLQDLEAQAAADQAVRNDPEGTNGDLSTILASAEQAFARMVDQARQRNEEQLRAIEAARRGLRDEMGRLAAWRTQMERVLASVRETMAHARAQIRGAPDRLRAVLTPTTDAIVSVDDSLVDLVDATERLPESRGSSEPIDTGPTWTVHVPEASNGSNGAVDPEDLAAIQEQYTSP